MPVEQVNRLRRSPPALRRPSFAFVLLPLAGLASAQSVELPVGGVIVAGQAAIGAPAGNAITITQSSAKAIVDWQGFSIGEGGGVRFDNGSGATLNRVTGTSASAIDGLLSASGSVYLLNPNGVIVGALGVVDVGGSFVASTLDLSDAAFMAGGDLPFAGASRAAVINLGRIGALGGDVALIATTVRNEGTIAAANGTAGLAAGVQVLLRDASLDGGRFTVEVGGAGTSATNAGSIGAAAVELRANGGNVYALAGNGGTGIRATGVSSRDGRIFLTAGDGAVTAAGDIVAYGAADGGGFVETSAATIDFTGARIDAGVGGTWLVDPADLVIDQNAANTISSTLQGGTNVTQTTSSLGSGGNGDIFVDPDVTIGWSTASALTLSAYRNVAIGANAAISSAGSGAITLRADNAGRGIGTVSFAAGARAGSNGATSIFYNPASYADPTSFSPFVTGPFTAYMLVNTAPDLQRVGTNLAGTYALGRDVDASGLTGFTPIGSAAENGFVGLFDGQKYIIGGLVIDRPGSSDVGLFGLIASGGMVRNLGLIGGRASGADNVGMIAGRNVGTIQTSFSNGTVTATGNAVGGVTGVSYGTLADVQATGSVSGGDHVGGLIGYNAGAVRSSDAGATVSGNDYVGGLTGFNGGTINARSSASGLTSGRDAVGGLTGFNDGGAVIEFAAASGETRGRSYVGGFAGYNSGTMRAVSATGAVNATDSQVGGLVGLSSNYIANSYATGSVGGRAFVGGAAGTNSGYFMSVDGFGAVTGTTYVGGIAGKNTGEITGSGHGDVTGTAEHVGGALGMNAGQFAGFAFGNVAGAVFTGGLIGWNTGTVGVVAYASGSVSGLDLVGGAIGLNDVTGRVTGGQYGSYNYEAAVRGRSYVGGFAGYNSGSIANVVVIRPVTATENQVGGIAGVNGGTIQNANNSGSVRGSLFVGGLVGTNGSTASITQGLNDGAVDGVAYVGGLVGKNEGSVAQAGSLAAVTASDYSVGGAVGSNDRGSVQKVYAIGRVTGRYNVGGVAGYNGAILNDSYSTATVSGADQVGGIAGINAGGGSIGTSYASGPLSFTGLGGGITGYNASQITDVYWDVGTTGAPTGIGSDVGSANGVTAIGGATGRDPRQQSTYRFDFADIWQISAPPPAGSVVRVATRPYLRRAPQSPPPQ